MIILALQTGMRESKLIDIHEEWLVQRGWIVARSVSRTELNKRVAKAIPSMTSPVQRCDVICPDPVVDSFGGGRTRTPSSIGGSKRLNGQGCMDSTFMTCAIRLPRGCSKPV